MPKALTLVADVVLVTVRLLLLAVAVGLLGYASFVSLLQTDIPWSAAVFAVLYIAAGTWLLIVVAQYLARRRAR